MKDGALCVWKVVQRRIGRLTRLESTNACKVLWFGFR